MLTAISLNASDAEPIVISGIQEQHHLFIVGAITTCDTYRFRVRTMAANVRSSEFSEAITMVIPSPPDISLVGAFVRRTLTRTTESEFELNISLPVRITQDAHSLHMIKLDKLSHNSAEHR